MNNFLKRFMVLVQNKRKLAMIMDNKIQISQSHLMMRWTLSIKRVEVIIVLEQKIQGRVVRAQHSKRKRHRDKRRRKRC